MTSANDSDFSHEGFTLGYITKQALQASMSDFFKAEKRDQPGENTQEKKDRGISSTKPSYLIWLEKVRTNFFMKFIQQKPLLQMNTVIYDISHITCMTEQETHLGLVSQCADSQRQKGLQPWVLFCFFSWTTSSVMEAFTPDTYNVL